jgi:hypothetical protein
MKMQHKGNAVRVSGAQTGPQNISIRATAEMFSLLSNALYSDKIRAIIRELSCNAWDSHAMAGKTEVPFEIHLPTDFEPTFSIKDFGTGLNPAAEYVYEIEMIETPYGKQFGEKRIGKKQPQQELKKGQIVKIIDEVVDLYCTYGNSNKGDSNETIGYFGVGSKSPFCYCEGFTIINRYDGVTTIYSAFINEEGKPQVNSMDSTATPDAVNGLEVTFPVKKNDIWEFENKAKMALEFFVPRPILNIDLDIPIPTYTIRTETWGMRSGGSGNTGLRAIQGKVQYTVGNIDISKLTEKQQSITSLPLDIFFPIGQLAVAASRETLQLDETTVANILAMLDNIYNSMLEEVQKKVDSCKEPWQARVLIYELSHAPGIGKLVNDAHNNGQFCKNYKNFTLADKHPVINQLDAKSVHVAEFSHNYRGSQYAKKEHTFCRGDKRLEMFHEVQTNVHTREDFDVAFPVQPNVLMVINDVKIGAEKYIHYFLQEAADNEEVISETGERTQSKVKTVFLFSRANKDVEVIAAVREAEDMMVKLGNPPCIRLSELKTRYAHILDARKAPTALAPARDILVLVDKVVSSTGAGSYSVKGWTKAWVRSDTQPAGRKFYIPVENLAATEDEFDTETGGHDLTEFVQNVKKSGKFAGITAKTPIYGLKKEHKLRAKKQEWVSFVPYVMGQIKKVMTPAQAKELSILYHDWDSGSEFDETLERIAIDKPLAADSPFQTFCEELAIAQKADDDDELKALVEVLQLAEERGKYTPANMIDYNEEWEKVSILYPMLSLISRNYSYDRSIEKENILLDYLRTMDASRKASSQSATAAVAGN